MKDDFKAYFEGLGYIVDHDNRGFECWWEILDADGDLILQIDKFVPLQAIICDLMSFHTGEPSL